MISSGGIIYDCSVIVRIPDLAKELIELLLYTDSYRVTCHAVLFLIPSIMIIRRLGERRLILTNHGLLWLVTEIFRVNRFPVRRSHCSLYIPPPPKRHHTQKAIIDHQKLCI